MKNPTLLEMKRRRLRFFFSTLVTMLFLLPVTIFSQDAYVYGILSPQNPESQNQPVTFEAVIGNNSDFPISELLVKMQIWQGVTIVFEQDIPVSEIPPNEQIDITSSPNEWVPVEPGFYTAQVEILFDGDINPDNNVGNIDFEVIPAVETNYHIYQVDMLNPYQIPNSTFGIFQYDYYPIDCFCYLNAMATNPNNGAVEWIVRNLPMLPHESIQTIKYWFDLGLLGVDEGADIAELWIKVEISENVLLEPFPVENWSPVFVEDFEYNVLSGNFGETAEVFPPTEISPIIYVPVTDFEWEFRGCDVPNIDLNNHDHPASPDYAGDTNACGPAAAGNSMKWLEENHPKIPDTGNTLREAVEEMSSGMDRANNEGVTTTQLVRGKLDYIDNHELPIHVKYQSWWKQDSTIASPNPLFGHEAENLGSTTAPKPPTWEFYKSEMDKGEDVEILFGWYDAAGVRHGGHWVTATGYYDDGNVQGIFIKDDGNQDTIGGTSQSYHDWIEQDGWGRLGGYSGANNNCWIESVVSESYDPSVTHDIFDLSLTRTLFDDDPYPFLCAFDFKFPPRDEIRYLNVRAKLPDASEDFWILRNILIPPFYETNEFSTWWDLSWIGVADVALLDKVHLEIDVSDDLHYDSFFDVEYEIDLPVKTGHRNIQSGANAEAYIPAEVVNDSFPVYDPNTINTYIYRGCEVPNIELDSLAHPGSETTTSDWNACIPAATANSMQWLEETNDSIHSNGLSHREKLEELKAFMHHNDSTGVSYLNMVKGKLAYIDAHKLPIHVKFQGWGFASGLDNVQSPNAAYGHVADNRNSADNNYQPTWDFLVSELEAGEDVELNIGIYKTKNGTTTRVGGHSMVVTGANSSGGVKRICVKDDASQGKPGGLEQNVLKWKPVGGESGQIIIPEWSWKNDSVKVEIRVEGIVSESYDPAITYPTSIGEILPQNPFDLVLLKNPTSIYENIEIGFTLPENEEVFIEIYDLLGQNLYRQKIGKLNKGKQVYTVIAKPLNVAGSYMLLLKAGNAYSSVKVVRN